jgi:hypothetical protein
MVSMLLFCCKLQCDAKKIFEILNE